MPYFPPLSTAVPSPPSSTAATAGITGAVARGDHAHPWSGATPADYGLAGWVFPIDQAGSSSILPTAGLLEVVKLLVPTAQTITNLYIYMSTAGNTLTNAYMALYNGAGSLLSQSADQSTAWGTNGFKTVALTAPQSVAAGTYYAAFWVGTATTMPTPARNANSAAINSGLSAANSRWATANTSITTTAPPSLGAFTAVNVAYWIGWS